MSYYGSRQRDYGLVRDRSARTAEDCETARADGFAGLEMKALEKPRYFHDRDALVAYVRAVMASPAGHALLLAEVARTVGAARDAATEEAREFLEELAEEVMES